MTQNGTFGRTMTRRWTAWGAAAAVGASMLVITASPVSAAGQATVNLGAGASYAVLTAATVGNTSATLLRGDLGLTSGTTPVGFPPGIVTGAINLGAPAQPGYDGLLAAYTDANARTFGAMPIPAADLVGLTLPPGLYTSAAAIANTGLVQLDGGGDPDAVFIFQIGGAINAAAGSEVRLINEAQAKNVFWQTDATAAIGANAKFAGTILAYAAVAVGANTIVNGRVFSVTAAIALDNNQFYSSSPTVSMTIDGGETAYTTDTSPTITGSTTERAPSTVTVEVNGETLSATPDADGLWSATPVGLLDNDTYQIVASVVDGAGNIGSSPRTSTVDTVLPVVAIDGGAAVITNDLTPTISGSTDVAAGERVTVTMDRDIPGARASPGRRSSRPTGPGTSPRTC